MTLEVKLKHALKSNNEELIHDVFSQIYYEYGKLIYFTISGYISTKEDIEELTEDVFISFYNSLDKTVIKNIKYYLVVSAKNKSINFLKKKKEEIVLDDRLIFDRVDETNVSLEYQEIIKMLNKVLSKFEVEIIIKHLVEGKSFKELSSYYDKPLNTIISTYHRAIKKFKKGVK